jgi:O-antigen ligase
MLIKKNYFNYNNLINILISLIPFSLIIGNSAINLNIILICILGVIIYRFDTFKINKKIYQYLIYSFFLYLIIITLIKNIPNINESELYREHILKSFFFLRFLILFFVISKLVEKNHFNKRLFFLSCSFFSFLVAVDIIIQIIFGKNLLGFEYDYRPTGFFGSEEIAGSYLQKISLFLIFFSAFLTKNKNVKFKYIYITFLFFFICLILINNRIPTLMFLCSFFIFLFITKKFKIIIYGILFSTALLFTAYKSVERLNASFISFYGNSKYLLTTAPRLFYHKEVPEIINYGTGHLIIFNSGIQQWKKNKIFGSGLKSFKLNCTYDHNQTCTSHPHNYFIEIALDMGLVGLVLIYLFFLISLFDYFKFYKKNQNFNSTLISLPFFLILLFEFFPIRSTGSFFTTNNAVIIFFMLAVFIGILNSKNSKVE